MNELYSIEMLARTTEVFARSLAGLMGLREPPIPKKPKRQGMHLVSNMSLFPSSPAKGEVGFFPDFPHGTSLSPGPVLVKGIA